MLKIHSLCIRLMHTFLIVVVLTACSNGDFEALEEFESESQLAATDEEDVEAATTATTNPEQSGEQSNHTTAHHCESTPSFAADDLVTHKAVQSGSWSDAQTWGGKSPLDGSTVHIPTGISVLVDNEVQSRLETVKIDGTLAFATDRRTGLQLDTLYSSCSGTLQMGTNEQPIQPDVVAKILFIDDGPVSDDQLLSRGAILKGRTVIHGAPKTHRAIISPHAKQGDSTLSLTMSPAGWQIDDELVITGTMPNNPESDEIRRVNAINGQQIVLDSPLSLDHTAPYADLNVYVANTTRNVQFESESQLIANRGHIMLMSANVDINNASFIHLGRTDKTTELNDFQFDFPDGGHGDDAPATAQVTALGGTNIRGRYAVHFHQTGTQPNSTPALVKGSVVLHGPGWGFVNHSSNVNFIDNVTYGLQGAGFYTEAGNEIGSMVGNIAIRSVNSSFFVDDQGAIDPDLRAYLMDYGNDGDGFWLTGNGVSMIDNVAAGASAHGIIFWTDGIMEPAPNTATRVTVKTNELLNGDLVGNRAELPVWWAPLATVSGNEAYGATVGFRARYIHAKHYLGRDEESDFHRSPPQAYIDTLTPTVEKLTVWGSRDGVLLNYNERMRLSDARIVGFGKNVSQFSFNDGTAKSGIGLDVGNDATHGPGLIEDVRIEGFGMGMATPVNGAWTVRRATLGGNGTDILIQPTETDSTLVSMQSVSYDSVQVVDSPTDELPNHVVFE